MISLILSFISGLLTGLSFNLPNLSFLVWFSIAPFIYSISRGNFRTNILSGVIFAFSFYGVTLFWVANVTSLGLILLLFYLSVYSVIFSLVGKKLYSKTWQLITFPSLWVVLEFLKENIWCGFGWANLGYSQYQNFHLIQVADLVGTKFISFLIVMVNVLILQLILSSARRNKDLGIRKNIFKKLVFVVFVFIAIFLYSFDRLKNLKETDSLEVSIVQPNIFQELKWDSFSQINILSTLSELAKKTEEDSLVIFPEASWPLVVDDNNFYELEQFIKNLNRDVLIGAVVEKNGEFFNQALLFDKQARLIESYRKIKLVPYGEYVPLRKFLTFISVFNSIGDMSRGNDFVSFSYKEKRFSTLICFEDIFPQHVIRFAKENDFLVNITNDAWFKGEPQASQHLSIMTLRAVENRISIIRSANTGISGWVSFKGEINKFVSNKKEVFIAGIDNFKISLNKKRSLYNRYGEFFPFICIILLFGAFIRKKGSC